MTAPPEQKNDAKPDGGAAPISGWVHDDGEDKWYCFDEDGKPQTGWVTRGGERYYLVPDGPLMGELAAGWQRIDGAWYYFGAETSGEPGVMYANRWMLYKNAWYWFKADGSLARSETLVIDGVRYTFDESGARTDA